MSFLRTRLPQKTQHLPQKQLLQVPARCSALPPGLWRERRLLTGEREPTCAAPEPAGTFRNPPQGAAGSLRLLQRGEVVCPSSPTEHPGRGLARSWRLPAEPALGQQQGAVFCATAASSRDSSGSRTSELQPESSKNVGRKHEK